MSKYVVVKGNQVIIAKYPGFVIFSGDLDFSSRLYGPHTFDYYFSAKLTAWLYGGQVKTFDQYPMKELEEILNIELMIPCTIAKQKANMHYLIKNKDK